MARQAAEFVLGVDLDGCCADFYGGLRPIAAEWLGVPVESLPEKVSYGLPEWRLTRGGGKYDDLHRFAITQRNLFRDLPPFHGVATTLRRLSARGVRIRIITHRLFIKYFHQEAVRQTIEWLDHHDIPYWDLCLTKDKVAVNADLYVEDAPRNVEQLRAAGKPVAFSNSTNLHLPGMRADTWADVEPLVLAHLRDWKQKRKNGTRSSANGARPARR